MVALRVTADTRRFDHFLTALSRRLDDMTPVMESIGAAIEAGTRLRFDREAGPDGNPWPPSLRAQITGGKTLQDTGALKNSLAVDARRDVVFVGSNLIYSAIHQFGGVIRPVHARALVFRLASGEMVVTQKVTMPARPYLGLDDDDVAGIRETLVHYLRTGDTP